ARLAGTGQQLYESLSCVEFEPSHKSSVSDRTIKIFGVADVEGIPLSSSCPMCAAPLCSAALMTMGRTCSSKSRYSRRTIRRRVRWRIDRLQLSKIVRLVSIHEGLNLPHSISS